MTYKLAKRLKEAGFPQPERSEDLPMRNGNWIMDVYEPTLEELIDACGEGFFSLERNDREWNAAKHPSEQRGKTPLEAVAKLYIKLNAK